MASEQHSSSALHGDGGDTVSNSPSSSTLPTVYKYDVFISFRGPDTRNTFVDHLHAHLTRKGIFAFKDDLTLHKGESISQQLLQAIRDSRVSIVVFSEKYAESTWCLDEMAAIAECRQQLNQTVFPVFYDVHPSHARNQGFGVFHDAFVSHIQKFKHDLARVDRWQRAMASLAGLAGWDVRNKSEFQEIEKIVQAVIRKLGHKFSNFTNDLIGIQPRVEELEKLLRLNSQKDDVLVLGIWGMGGIGKTTHATALYDRISYQFDAPCFVENVSKIYREGGAIAVQKQILRQTLDEKNLDSYNACQISEIITNRLHSSIKILLVLDNVDQLEQLQELAINPKLLCLGSRIIITTRDEHILRVYGVDEFHEVPLLNNNDASELFCSKAFKNEHQSSSYMELIPEVLSYVQRLPLAIRVMGSFLCTRDAVQWRDALDRLENNPLKEITDVLQISVDGLQHEEKETFLHIACFFKGERVDYIKQILDACGLHPHIGIQSMIEKSLITIRNQEIHMHEMLQELGKKIVRHQCPGKPGSWSRLWLYKDFYHVLETKSGTDNVEAIVLNQTENVSKCKAEGLSNLRSLRLLILYQKNFWGRLTFLSNNLQYFLWNNYPFPGLPSTFEPYYLVELNMPDSSIQRLWKGTKHLPCLKRMDMSNSKYLLETPCFEGIPKLERLDLTGCTNLLHVHPSVGVLTKLAFLSLRNCRSLVRLNFGNASNLCSLKVLHLSGCTKLEFTPYFTGIPNLEYLDMDQCTSLSMVDESIGALVKLRFLSLRECTNLVTIPNNVNAMTSLITLDLCGCLELTKLPLRLTSNSSFQLESLISLDVSFCNLLAVPSAIGELRSLERINLQGNKFSSLPQTTERLSNLSYLNVAHCYKLQYLPMLSKPSKCASSVGKYFKIASGSHDHRSGLYIFDCPKFYCNTKDFESIWLKRLVKQPRLFRCGFDIIVPGMMLPLWFEHRFDEDSIIRIVDSDVDDSFIGFVFCVTFMIDYHHKYKRHSSSPPLPHPFYLSFESEHTEERFDMPLNLGKRIYGSNHMWMIYISRQHCHFLKTGAHITFKANSDLLITQWGLRMLSLQNREELDLKLLRPERLAIDKVEKSNRNLGPKIQLPYNWFVSEEDEVEIDEAKGKEINLSNMGLSIGQLQ